MFEEINSALSVYRFGFIVLFATIVFVISLINSNRALKYLDAKFSDRADWLVRELDTVFIDMKRQTALILIYASTLGIGFIIFVLMLPNFVAGIIIGGALGYAMSVLPTPFIQMLKTRRAATFNMQMVDALTLMSNGLRSGLNIVQAVELVVNEMPNPISQEFNLLLAQNKIGVPIDEGFTNLSKRLDLEDMDMFATSILILRETGGNLAETFDTIVATIRDRVKLSAKVKALTAQGVTQAIVLTMIPFGLLGVQYASNPVATGMFFTTPVGNILLGIMFLMQGLGGYVIKKVITIKV